MVKRPAVGRSEHFLQLQKHGLAACGKSHSGYERLKWVCSVLPNLDVSRDRNAI